MTETDTAVQALSTQIEPEPLRQIPCSSAGYTHWYTDPSPEGSCAGGYFRPYNQSYRAGDNNHSKSDAFEWRCQHCSLQISNCCSCLYPNSTSTNSTTPPQLNCTTCATEYSLINDVTCVLTPGSLSGSNGTLIACLSIFGVILVFVCLFIFLKRKGYLNKSNAATPPQLPSADEWTDKSTKLKPALDSDDDHEPQTPGNRRYTADPAAGLPGRKKSNRVESVIYRELELSALHNGQEQSKTSAAKNTNVKRSKTSIEPSYTQDEELYVNAPTVVRHSATDIDGHDTQEIYMNMSGSSGNNNADAQGNDATPFSGRSKSVGNPNDLHNHATHFQSLVSDQNAKGSSKKGPVLKDTKFIKPQVAPKPSTASQKADAISTVKSPQPKAAVRVNANNSAANYSENEEIYENNPATVKQSQQNVDEDSGPEEDYENMEEVLRQQKQGDLQKGSKYFEEDENIYANQ